MSCRSQNIPEEEQKPSSRLSYCTEGLRQAQPWKEPNVVHSAYSMLSEQPRYSTSVSLSPIELIFSCDDPPERQVTPHSFDSVTRLDRAPDGDDTTTPHSYSSPAYATTAEEFCVSKVKSSVTRSWQVNPLKGGHVNHVESHVTESLITRNGWGHTFVGFDGTGHENAFKKSLELFGSFGSFSGPEPQPESKSARAIPARRNLRNQNARSPAKKARMTMIAVPKNSFMFRSPFVRYKIPRSERGVKYFLSHRVSTVEKAQFCGVS